MANTQEELNRSLLNVCQKGTEDEVQQLLTDGASVDYTDFGGWTPLHHAASANANPEVCKVLIQSGSNLSAKTIGGCTPLHFAAASNPNVNVTSLLIQAGSDVLAKDDDERTPLHLAAGYNKNPSVADCLIQAGADISAKDKYGNTPLHQAAMFNNESMTEAIIQAGADISAKNNKGETPLDYARYNDNKQVLRLIQAYISGEKKVYGLVGFSQHSELRKILSNESNYESFDMRIMVVGKHGVGKTTLVMLLVGGDIPMSRTPTDGISLIEGWCGLDITSKEWIPLDKDSYNAKDFLYNRMLIPPSQEDTEMKDDITNPTDFRVHKGQDINEQSGEEAATSIATGPLVLSYTETSVREEAQVVTSETVVEDEFESRSKTDIADSQVGKTIHAEMHISKSKMKTTLSKVEFQKRLELALKNGTYKMQMGRLFFWDFGGQYVFYTTHQSFLTYRALYLVIFDGTEDLHDTYTDEDMIPGQHGTATSAVFLQHWVNSILTYCKSITGDVPKILFVATHKDEIQKEKVEERRTTIFDAVDQLFQDHEGRNHLVLNHRIFVNARDKTDPEIESLRQIITELTLKHPCWGERMPNSWVPLEIEITELVRKGEQIISLRQLEQLNNDSKVSVLDKKALKSFLLIQHSLGKIVYFDTPQLKDFVIISPVYMVEVTKSVITDKHFWPTDSKGKATFQRMAQKGIISKKALFSLWKKRRYAKIYPYSEYIFQMLLHLDILAEQRRYDLDTGSRIEVEELFVPCMLICKNPTDYLDQVCVPEHAVGMAFVFKGAVVPPALPNRLISACLDIWALKTYKGATMMFSGFIVLAYDKSHDVVICAESNRILLFLIHTRDKGLIVKDIATSVRQCIQESLARISNFYERSITGQSSDQLPFHVQHACPELTCFQSASEILNKIITCPNHSKQYEADVWYQNKDEKICEENCTGLNSDALSKTPSDLELLRLSLQFDTETMYNLAIHLGITVQEWTDMREDHPNNIKIVKYLILIQWRDKFDGTFGDVSEALLAMKEDTNIHNLCQVRRTKIKQSALPEQHIGLIPTDEIIDALATEVIKHSFQLGVELGIKVTELETIQCKYERDPVKQSREILHSWRDDQTIKPTFGVLEQALMNAGKGSMCLTRIMADIGVKTHQFPQTETLRRKKCSLM